MRTGWIAIGLAVAASAHADTLEMKDGRTIDGTYLGGDARLLRMTVGDKVESFDVNEVRSIRFGDFSKSASMRRSRDNAEADSDRPTLRRAPGASRGVEENDRPVLRRLPAAEEENTARIMRPDRALTPQVPAEIEIPADTPLVVRMIDSIDSQRDQVGQTFRASLDQPVVIRGETVIPRGADVVVKLVEDTHSGRLTGKTELILDLSSIAIGGKLVDLLTQTVKSESSSRTSGTVKKAGTGAAIGAVIGAIAGGGAGAAIGAAAGGAAGTGAQVMTKGQRVRIPSETRLTFKLEQAIRI